MFEKEAKEYAIENYENCLYDDFPYTNDSKAIEQSFKDGAEFGYNKANEWHYPSKGEYPKEYKNVLCYCKVVNIKFYSIGHITISGDGKVRWWSNNKTEELKVYAWKEIEPPKDEILSHKEDILQSACNAYSISRDLLETPDIIKCAECGNIIDLPEAQIKRYCLHQESNYRNCLCVSCSQKCKQTLEMANIKPSDLIYFGRKI